MSGHAHEHVRGRLMHSLKAKSPMLLILHLQFNQTGLRFTMENSKDKDHPRQPLPVPGKKQTEVLINANSVNSPLLNDFKFELFLEIQIRKRKK